MGGITAKNDHTEIYFNGIPESISLDEHNHTVTGHEGVYTVAAILKYKDSSDNSDNKISLVNREGLKSSKNCTHKHRVPGVLSYDGRGNSYFTVSSDNIDKSNLSGHSSTAIGNNNI